MAQGNSNNNHNVLVEFNLDDDDWEIFVQRLEFHFIACNILNEKKPAVPLTRLEVNAYNLLQTLVARKLKELTFDELVEVMQYHLSPPHSEAAEMAKFAMSAQQEGKSIS